AAQLNGKWIKASDLQSTSSANPIADNAVRVNLVDSNNNVVKSFDFTKTGVKKGDTLGTQTNGAWTLANADQTSIQTAINNALNGTNFNLTALSTAQQAALAQAKFGESVNLTVNANATINQNQVGINFIDANTNQRIGSTAIQTNNSYLTQSAAAFIGSLGFKGSDTAAGTTAAGLLPNGFTDKLDATGVNGLTNTQSAANAYAISQAGYGKTINYYVKNLGTSNFFGSTTTFNYKTSSTDTYTGAIDKSTYSFNNVKNQNLNAVVSALASDKDTAGSNDSTVTFTQALNAAKAQGADSFYIVQIVPDSGAAKYVTATSDLTNLDPSQKLYIQKFDLNTADFASTAALNNGFKITTTGSVKLPYTYTTKQVTAAALKGANTTTSDVATAYTNSSTTVNNG
ncbi:MAG: hypothetical protein ABF486_14205, partial [Lentilactobacillus hilgardii]